MDHCCGTDKTRIRHAVGWTAAVGVVVLLALAAGSPTAAQAGQSQELSEKRGGGVATCPCPCSLSCGNDVTCTCTGSTGKCRCGQISLIEVPTVDELDELTLRLTVADWFGMAPLEKIEVAVEGVMDDTRKPQTIRLAFLPIPGDPERYRVDPASLPEGASGWLSRLDAGHPIRITFAASGDDPGTYVIRDGDAAHLHDSLRKELSVVTATGPVVLFTSDSTLAWELKHHLRTAVTCLAPEAFAAPNGFGRDALYVWVDTLDVLLKTSDYVGLLEEVRSVEARAAAAGLSLDHSDAWRLVRAVGDLEDLVGSLGDAGRPTAARPAS